MTTETVWVHTTLRKRVTCPHCWHRFPPEETLWISENPALMDDPKLGPDHQLRFLPTRFDVAGNAIDAEGMVCRDLACPNCHLIVARPLFELKPLFASILGGPSCGKSYFLAAMTWRLRRTLPHFFQLAFGDADPASNRVLNDYEELQFFNPVQDAIVKLRKTDEEGDLYDEVRMGDGIIRYPRPFLFSLQPLDGHPNQKRMRKIARVLCLYDNAGESFQPGKDTPNNPVTRHLARSQLLMFLFDPTQDPRFRDACRDKTQDIQMTEPTVTARQETVLHEVANRIRRYTGLSHGKRHQRPMLVVVTKYDAWSALLPGIPLRDPWSPTRQEHLQSLDATYVEQVSQAVRELLWQYSPEVVAAAEGFSESVVYIPCSATGCAPMRAPDRPEMIGFRPRDISPMWAEVPLLYALGKWTHGLIGRTRRHRAQRSG